MNQTDRDSEDDEGASDLPDLKEVVKAKERDPMMFVSGFDADESGIVPSENPNSPGERLLRAAEGGDLKVVTEILTSLPDLINYRDTDGYTALHRACYEDNLEIARVLISRGANLSACSDESWTPLHSACHWNSFRCVRLLLENGADINARTKGDITPLHLACGNNSARQTIIILLTEPGIDVNVKNKAGETAYEIGKRSTQHYHLFEMFRQSIVKI